MQEQQQQKRKRRRTWPIAEVSTSLVLVSSRLVFGVHISYRLVANAAAPAAGSKGRQWKSSSTIRCLGGDMCS